MPDPTRAPGTWLVLGGIHLLHGTAPPRDDEIIVVVPIPRVETVVPSNTIVLRWNTLGPVTLTARTLDGTRRAHARDSGATLFTAMLPGPGLRQVTATISPHAHPEDETAKTWVPLFYVSAIPAGAGLINLHVYSQIRFLPEDACFIRITPTPLQARSADDLSWLPTAVELHARQAAFLNSHESYYRKCFDGQELEYKYTLPPTTNIWALTLDTYRRLRACDLPGFMPRYRDELQTWDYLNHLFEITASQAERGYVSFIPTTDGKHLVKRKWFTQDAFARGEHHTFGAVIDGPLEDYVRDVLKVQAHRLPSFRRIRYDVNIESTRTGHLFSVLYDRCSLLTAPDIALSQCEVEYTRSRTAIPPEENDVLHEIDTLASWLEALLAEHELDSQRGHYSKLTFLRDAVAQHPHLTLT